MSNAKEPIERAKEVLVYGPVGLAMYLRDTAPSFMKVFVARGRAELDQQRRTVGDQLGQARTIGASATDSTAPQLLRLVAEGLGRVRETAEGAIGTISGWAGESVSDAPGTPETEDAADHPDRSESPQAHGASAESTSSVGEDADDPARLAIAGYDELSASQVVDRLDGLSPDDLAAIRDHERATRARATILGKIEQLEHPA